MYESLKSGHPIELGEEDTLANNLSGITCIDNPSFIDYKKIESLIGHSFNNPDDLFPIHLGIKLWTAGMSGDSHPF